MGNASRLLDVYTSTTALGLTTREHDFGNTLGKLSTLMHDQISWAQAAWAHVLRPLVRLALAMGLKHPHLEGVLRDLLIEEARKIWLNQGVGKPNISQLATTSGLNRKDVTARVRSVAPQVANSGLSPAAMVFTRWLQLATRNPARRRIPIKSAGKAHSFERLARFGSKGNVHHRSMLDELVRLGMATEQDGHVELTADGFVPARDLQGMLAFLAGNAHDHIQAAVANTLGETPKMLERAVYADGLTPEECERLHAFARQRWSTLHGELVDEMTKSVDRSGPDATMRIKVGVYALYESTAQTPQPEGNKTAIASASATQTRKARP